MGGGAEGAAVDLGQAEGGVVGGDDHVGVADQADAAAEAEAVDRGDHRHRALVDGGERGVAAPVGADQGVEALGRLHLLDVDAGVEAAALGPQHDHPHRRVARRASDDASASSNQPATVRAFTGGLSITTSAMPRSSTDDVVPNVRILSDRSSDSRAP